MTLLVLSGTVLLAQPAPAESPRPEGPADTAASPPPGAGAVADGSVELQVDPHEITVGEHFAVRLEVRLPSATRLVPAALGTRLGPFTVVDGDWVGPTPAGAEAVWTWTGHATAYRTGDLELPAIRLRVEAEGGAASELVTEPVQIRVRSVLQPAERDAGAADPADLKPPAAVPPNWSALYTALGLVLLLLALAGVAWWLQRRFAARLAAVQAPDDPFHRTPPHVWVYAELQRLLERRLPEQGDIDTFYAELSRILKRYLGGRYRLELMEQTTEEVPASLEQAGAPREATVAATTTLGACDRVKFARERPGPAQWKAAVEDVYRIVDRTKPIEAEDRPATRGVA